MSVKDLWKSLEVNSVEGFDEQFKIQEKIGEGSFGAVYRAEHIKSGMILALKSLNTTTSEKEQLMEEIEIMRKCDSNYIVHYFGNFFKGSTLWIIMEYCHHGSIGDILYLRKKPFNEKEIAIIIKDSLRGLDYLHSKELIHRDIKSDNILMNDRGECKLSDLGVAGIGNKSTIIGTPVYVAPEIVINDGYYDCKVDIWSLGITCIELAETKTPYHDDHPMRVKKITKN